MKIFVMTFAALLATISSADNVDVLVASRYPTVLSELAVKYEDRETRQQAWARVASGGKDYIFAAYSNGNSAAVALMELQGNDLVVKDFVQDKLFGYDPALTLVDVDGDGQREVIVDLTHGPRGGETWVFRVANAHLVAINAVEKHGMSKFEFPDLVDLEAKGSLHVVQRTNVGGSRMNPNVRFDHYVVENGKYVQRGPFDFYKVFERQRGTPTTETETFSTPSNAIGKPYRLSIINGATDPESRRVSAATVTLNDVKIAVPSDFRQSRTSWTIPVTLQSNNTISVRLEGDPGGRIAVAILHD